MSLTTSIILCTYNEANYIESTISELKKNISNLELIIIDDNSSDQTRDIINKLNKDNKIKLIERKKSRGLASAFLRGVIESSGNYVGWIDTNMSEFASKFVEMQNILNSDSDIVLLSRYVDGGGDERDLLRSLSSKYFNYICRFMFRQPIKDYTSSIFLMKRSVINEVTFLGYGHGDFFIEFLYNAYKKNFNIKEIPYVQKKDDELGISKSAPNLFKFFYLGLMYILRLFVIIIRRN